jgi:hypothetical protein
VDFYVNPAQANVILFTFVYSYACVTSGFTTDGIQRPIASNSFSGSNAPLDFSGTFDSSTSAHGTVGVTNLYPGCLPPVGNVTAGPNSWTATRQDASQPS